MRIFLAGASGVIGRRLVPLLLAAGHEVAGMTRSAESGERLRELGVEPVVCDVFDRESLERAVIGARPEVVVHQLTSLPKRINPRTTDFGPNNRIRREGTANLMASARAAGARRVVAQSIAFIYVPAAGAADEDDPVTDFEGPAGETVRPVRDLERQVTTTEGIAGVALRFGYFYGPGTAYGTAGSLFEDVERRRFPVAGSGTGVFSFVHVDDAAAATLVAIEGSATGIFNVVDDEPAPVSEWLPAYASAIGAKRPRRVPSWLVRVVGGPGAVAIMLSQRGASNARAKRDLGWNPEWPSWRQGFTQAPR
jgi:nucleoside-diphosphate-sugar epimerase